MKEMDEYREQMRIRQDERRVRLGRCYWGRAAMR